MNNLVMLAVLLGSGFELSRSAEPQQQAQPQQVQQLPLKIVPYGKGEVVANEVLVLFKREASALDKAAVLEALDGIVRRGFGDERLSPRWLAIRSQSLSTAQMVTALRGHPAIHKVQPHYFRRPPGSKEEDWMETEIEQGGLVELRANEVLVRWIHGFPREGQLRVLNELNAVYVGGAGAAGLARSRSCSARQLAAALASHPMVKRVQPNFIYKPLHLPVQAVPNDPLYANQWGLPRMNAPQAWNLTSGNTRAVMAILDTGVHTSHEDLLGNMWTATRDFSVRLKGANNAWQTILIYAGARTASELEPVACPTV